MRILAIILAIIAAPAYGDVVGPGGKVIDCFCTDKTGSRVDLGQTICLEVDGRRFMARCEMSLNVPMWREQSEGCTSSGLLQRLQPRMNPSGIDAKI